MKTLHLPATNALSQNSTATLSVRVADTFMQRLRGLLGRPHLQCHEGLLITRCNSVHMLGMRYAIDVVYLDARGTILKCVQNLRPWRISLCRRACIALELSSGAVDRYGLRCGQQLPVAAMLRTTSETTGADTDGHAMKMQSGAIKRSVWRRHTGASMVEFVIIAPALIAMGMGSVQYGLLFFAKNNINYATFEAARAGAMENASIDAVTRAYRKALIPMYGGGTDAEQMTASYERVKADTTERLLRVELLNPTRESFDDWNAKPLQHDRRVGNGKRVIPVLMQAFPEKIKAYDVPRGAQEIGPRSGQNLADASLIKVRVIHGYRPQVPIVGRIMTAVDQLFDAGDDPFRNSLYAAGRIPVVSHVTLQMQSDAIESSNVSSPGMGNGGVPVNPDPQTTPANPRPDCLTAGCGAGNPPAPPAAPAQNPAQSLTPIESEPGTCPANTSCPSCGNKVAVVPTELSADALFAFDKSTMNDLLPGGRQQLDQLIAKAKAAKYASANVIGHTDQLGSVAHNDALSLARAKTIRDYLKANGLPDLDITTEGRGATEPKVELKACRATGNAQIKCLQPNRRVVVEFKAAEQGGVQ